MRNVRRTHELSGPELPVVGHMQGERFLQLRLLTVAIAYALDDYRKAHRRVA